MAKYTYKLIVLLLGLFLGSSAQALSLKGVTSFAASFDLNTATPGVVQAIHVKPGQRVRKGDVLIQLDATPHKARLIRAQANEKSLLPEVEIAQLELERVQELYDIDSLSQVDLKNAENKLTRAEGAFRIAQAETTLAKYQLDQTMIRAPVDGRVIQVYVNIASYMDPAVDSNPLLTLVESRHMLAIGLLNSDQWNAALLNKEATIQYHDKRFNGRVSYIGYALTSQSGGKGAYEVHIAFETDHLIPSEMPVTIDIKD